MKKSWVTLLCILALLILGIWAMINLYAGLLGFGERGNAAVPSVVGMTVQEAKRLIEKRSLSLTVSRSEANATAPANTIISQDPEPGIQVKKGRSILAVVSTGPELIAVPDLVGLDLQAATIQLGNAKLNLGNATYKTHRIAQKNVVISQEPSAGENVPAQTPVNLTVSLGSPPEVTMPKIVGNDLTQAKSSLEDAKLQLGEIGWKIKSDSPPGEVLTQNPEPGAKVHEGDMVSLVVSAGSVDKILPFKQSTITITLPAFQGEKEVKVLVTDSESTNVAYRGVHPGNQTIQLMVSGYGDSKVEVYLGNELLSSGNL